MVHTPKLPDQLLAERQDLALANSPKLVLDSRMFGSKTKLLVHLAHIQKQQGHHNMNNKASATIGIALIIGIAITSMLGAISAKIFQQSGAIRTLDEKLTERGFIEENRKSDFSSAHDYLGAVTQTSGFGFPTTTYEFSDNDIINSEDFNLILRWIGTRNSTSGDSLAYYLRSSTSTNPGHLHTTSAVSGTIAVAQGGTGTSTLPANAFVIGNGTSSVSSLAATQSGQLPIASGTTWVANPLTAGAGVTITTSTGAITIASTAGGIIAASSTNVAVSNTAASTTVMSVSVPADTLNANVSGIKAEINFNNLGHAGIAGHSICITPRYGGASLPAICLDATYLTGNTDGKFELGLFSNASTTSQWGKFAIFPSDVTGGASSTAAYTEGTISGINSTAAQTLDVIARWSTANANNTLTVVSYDVVSFR